MNEPTPSSTMTPPKQRRWRKWLLRTGIVAFLVLGFWLGYYWLYTRSVDQQLQEAIAAVDQADPGWRMADLEAKRRPIADEQNGALIVLAAVELLPDEWPNSDLSEQLSEILQVSPEIAFTDEQQVLLQAELGRADSAVRKARELVAFPTGRYVISWQPGYLTTPFPHLAKAWKLAQLLGYDAILRIQKKDLDGALLSCRAAFNVGSSIGDEPTILAVVVRIACMQRALHQIERTLAQGQVPAASLNTLQKCLEEEDSFQLLPNAVRGDRAVLHEALASVETGQLSLEQLSGGRRPTGIGPSLQNLYIPTVVKGEHVLLLQHMTQFVRLTELPYPDQADALEQFEADLQLKPTRIASLFIPSVKKCATALQRSRANLRCTIVALAAERYRLAHDSWPESLETLVPQWLPGVATDPFNVKPLRLRRLPDGVAIYSIGPDQTDNAGNLHRRDSFEPGTDVGFRLWDVAQRRQPPRPWKFPED
jgi:hypothetical protein